jgi:polar amino acid transport system substrate-binding protein
MTTDERNGNHMALRKWAPKIFILMFVGLAVLACEKKVPEKPEPAKTARETPPIAVQPAEEKPASPQAATIEAIKQRGELRVGMQVGYVPFQMVGNEGNVVGFDVDLAEMAAKSLNVGLRIIKQNWQELIPALLEGRTDVIISGMTVTPERNTEVMFTEPLLETGRMFLVHVTNADRFKAVQDINKQGVFVASVPGGVGELRLRDTVPNAAYREFPDRAQALKEVLERRAHAYIDEEFSIRLACATHPKFLTSSFRALTYEPVAWAVRPGEIHWLNWLNNFIQKIKGDGRLEELKKKWMQDYFLDLPPAK